VDRSSRAALDRAHSPSVALSIKRERQQTSIVQQRGRDHGRGIPRHDFVAGHPIDARVQTGTAPDEKTEMRYPIRVSELVHRRLRVPSSPLRDSSSSQLHAGTRGEDLSRTSCLTWDIRAMCPAFVRLAWPLAIMPSADQVPVIFSHSTVRWPKWVVLITGSTRSALRAVGPLQPFAHAVAGAIPSFIAEPIFA
jgi:hypothetical protein